MTRRRIFSNTGLALAAVLAMAVIIVANALLTGLRLDLTENRLFTLSDGTVKILRSLEEPIDIDFYFSRKTLADYPLVMNYATRVRDLLEEYAAKAGGKLRLRVIEPEPFSEAEDQAVAAGLDGIAVNSAGDRGYFGLVGRNSTDDQSIIPFFHANREAALEYDITKLIWNLAHPDKRVVGVISSLPVFGGPVPAGRGRAWTVIEAMREFFEVRNLGTQPERIDEEVSVLLVIHPKDLKDHTLYAIDQFILSGKPALIFVDPLAESDPAQPPPDSPYTVPDLDSDLKFLFDAWGGEMREDKLAADILQAMRVQAQGQRGPIETDFPPWLRVTGDSLNREDFITSELDVVHLGTAGILQKKEDSKVQFTPLIQTTAKSMAMERDLLLFQRDPTVLLQSFEPGNRRLALAARITGKVKTAYPDGPPPRSAEEEKRREEAKAKVIAEGDINVIVVADTDILTDNFWIRTQSFFGIEMPQAIANNGDFVINAIENLAGGSDLVSLRSRGRFARPFEVVDQIRLEAERQFRQQEQALQAKLEETERKILELQKEGSEGGLILTPEQAEELERFREEQVKTRRKLRNVQHELRKNIERLGTQLKIINIGLMPALIALLAMGAGLYRVRRRA